MNKAGISAGDHMLPIEKINRAKVEGFVKYFHQRQLHFQETFGCVFSPEAAKGEFDKIRE